LPSHQILNQCQTPFIFSPVASGVLLSRRCFYRDKLCKKSVKIPNPKQAILKWNGLFTKEKWQKDKQWYTKHYTENKLKIKQH